ncbi:MAG: hypothetical protein HYU36_04750 [Planctomycetes bacterium]|nr:hypothetical protein [Planctomycetota bacterium]
MPAGRAPSTFSLLLEVGAASASFTPAQDIPDGEHVYSFSISDRATNSVTASLAFRVDASGPEVTLDPSDGSTASSGRPLFTVRYSDAVTGVKPESLNVEVDGTDVTAHD